MGKFICGILLIAGGVGVAELGFPWTLIGLGIAFVGCVICTDSVQGG